MLLVEAFYSHEYTPCIFTLDLFSLPSFPCCRKGYGSVLPERDTHVNHLASNEWLAVRQTSYPYIYSATSYSLIPAEPDGRCTVNTTITYLLPTELLLFRIAAPSIGISSAWRERKVESSQ
jgi:hypothetical protein